jgi:hypothetical protein
MNTGSHIRLPAVSGLFYPGEARALAAMVDEMLGSLPSDPETARITGMVSPHAGYVYSGRVAAHGFRALAARAVSNPVRAAVVVGPSHVEAFDFTSVFDGDAYRTPLGDVAVDRDLARRLAAAHPSIRLSGRGHVKEHGRGEHGIEVLLPFLQCAAGACSIVPVVMGTQDWESCAALGRAIAEACDPADTVVIASSDLSHFHDARRAEALDRAFCAALETADARLLSRAVSAGECEACGAGPVIATLLATDRAPSRVCRVLARTHSGEVTGDRASVVGYASAIIVAGETPWA